MATTEYFKECVPEDIRQVFREFLERTSPLAYYHKIDLSEGDRREFSGFVFGEPDSNGCQWGADAWLSRHKGEATLYVHIWYGRNNSLAPAYGLIQRTYGADDHRPVPERPRLTAWARLMADDDV